MSYDHSYSCLLFSLMAQCLCKFQVSTVCLRPSVSICMVCYYSVKHLRSVLASHFTFTERFELSTSVSLSVCGPEVDYNTFWKLCVPFQTNLQRLNSLIYIKRRDFAGLAESFINLVFVCESPKQHLSKVFTSHFNFT